MAITPDSVAEATLAYCPPFAPRYWIDLGLPAGARGATQHHQNPGEVAPQSVAEKALASAMESMVIPMTGFSVKKRIHHGAGQRPRQLLYRLLLVVMRQGLQAVHQAVMQGA